MKIAHRTKIWLLSALLTVAAGVAGCSSPPARDVSREETNRTVVLGFYDGFFNQHQTEQAAKVVADDYKQHNPMVPNGKAPFVKYFTDYFAEHPKSHADIVRSATDGDLVYLHVHSVEGPGDRGSAVVDIFRVTDGKIVEHWDVIQNVPETSANTNTMF